MRSIALIIALLCIPLRADCLAADAVSSPVVSVDFERTNIESAFHALGELMHLNIVLHPTIRGTVNLHLKDTPLDKCFEVLLRIKGLYAIRQGQIILIYPLGLNS